MEKTKAELDETRKNLKSLTKYVIGHLEALLEKYGPLYPRLTTKSARHEEVDVKAVAFKAFKVSYDRETGYVGYKVSGEEFKLECTKFDKILLVFKDGTYKVTELPEKLFVGQELFYCGLPERERVFTCAYTDRDASYLKRFTFGGTILNKAYSCIPDKSRILYFRAGHAEDALRPLQARAAPENLAADVRAGTGRSEIAEDARPADFHQGHFVRHRRTDARLGRKRGDDENCVCVSQKWRVARFAVWSSTFGWFPCRANAEQIRQSRASFKTVAADVRRLHIFFSLSLVTLAATEF